MTDLVAAVSLDRIRVRPSSAGPVLPIEDQGEGWPSVAELARAVEADSVLPLAPALRVSQQPDLTVHLVQIPDEATGGEWLDLTELNRLAHPPSVAAAIRTGLAEHAGTAPWPRRRPAWFTHGWWAEVEGWIDRELARAGLQRAGASNVVSFWSLSAVLQVPLAGSPVSSVFFKATCDHFRAEPVVTALLARRVPARVPEVLAIDAARSWMLMLPLPEPAAEHRATAAPAAARALAEVQVALASHTRDLLAAGAPDRTTGPTAAALRHLVHHSVELDQLSDPERRQAVALLPWWEEQLRALEDTGMPMSVGHGDLHAGNYVVGPAGVVIFDWTDAALTFPALDAALLAASAGTGTVTVTLTDQEDPVAAAYADVWQAARPEVDVRAALRLARVVNLGYQAASYEGIYRSSEDRGHTELRGIVAANLRRLIQAWQATGNGG